MALSASLPEGVAVTIDCTATPVLGQPLVVLHHATGKSVAERFSTLTRREREMAECIGRGMTNRSIADRLSLSTATVKDHVHQLLAKTGFPNRTALAVAWRERTA